MQNLEIDNSDYISYRQHKIDEKDTPTIVFLHGLMSDKNGTKALSIEKFCIKNNYNFLTFDNLGHGKSSGKFTENSLDSWLECVKTVIKSLNLSNIILIGSSMGGWLSLLLGLSSTPEIKGMILLAPAPDFTKNIWDNLTQNQKIALENGDVVNIKSSPKYKGIPISINLINESKKHLLLQTPELVLNIPIVIVHGMQDKDVDYKISLELAEKISAPSLCVKLLKYSNHRLSEPMDLLAINNSITEIIKSSLY